MEQIRTKCGQNRENMRQLKIMRYANFSATEWLLPDFTSPGYKYSPNLYRLMMENDYDYMNYFNLE